MQKLKVAVLFGGRSGEHEVSLRSAASVLDYLDKEKYEIIPIGISREGEWWSGEGLLAVFQAGRTGGARVALLPEASSGELLYFDGNNIAQRVALDVVFPVLHGPYGEDGTVQGLLELTGIPYVGAGVLGSSVGMDKVVMKAILKSSGLPVGEYLYFNYADFQENPKYWLQAVEEKCGYPCFIKPANLGSSVGISKARDRESLVLAIREAALYDTKVVAEKTLPGKEIECSVLGNEKPRASVLGEIIPCNEFYDYKAKYIDDNSELVIPAPLPPSLAERVRSLAVKTFRSLNCAGLGRVDFFVEPAAEEIFVNEINTLPGFTSISMYPKLWEASGLTYADLLDELITLAIKRKEVTAGLRTTFTSN